MPSSLRIYALSLVLLLGLSSCSGIFGPEDILQDFEISRVDFEQGSIPDAPTADVREGTEQVTVDGWVVQGGCSTLEPVAEKSGSTLRFRIHRRTAKGESCPSIARTVRYQARLGPLEEGEYRLRVTLPGLGIDLESVTFVFNVEVPGGLTG